MLTLASPFIWRAASSCRRCATPTYPIQLARVPRLRASAHRWKDRRTPVCTLSSDLIGLCNSGMIAGYHAMPMVVPPTVAVVGANTVGHDVVVAVRGKVDVNRRTSISLTFGKPATPGSDGCRFSSTLLCNLDKSVFKRNRQAPL
ncbi:MAG: 2-oxo acid dehydrogenase subunit E2 [Rhodanobacter sp.]